MTLKLDLGRWGCEKYGNLRVYNDSTVFEFCKMLEALDKLEGLYLNLRSWAYENEHITDLGVVRLF